MLLMQQVKAARILTALPSSIETKHPTMPNNRLCQTKLGLIQGKGKKMVQ